MDFNNKETRTRIWVLGIWILICLVQGAFTELLDDEAYYWNYGKHLAWGYFHQPPMIAFMIRLGTLILPGELGVRLPVIVMSVLTLLLLEKLCDWKDTRLFYILVLSLAFVHVGSLLAAPDVPLLFFSVLFLLQLRRYLEKDSWQTATLVGIIAACVIYSKYHGIFLLGLCLLANLNLLRRPSLWFAVALAALLISPHLIWSYANGFPAYHYHYINRMAVDWDFTYPLHYLSGWLAIGLPIMGLLLFWETLRRKIADPFERTLKVFFVGTILIFFAFSFRGRIEANWLVSAMIPSIVLGHRQISTWKAAGRKWVFITGALSIALILFARLYMVVDLFPGKRVVNQQIHHSREWNLKIASLVKGDMPVVFFNEYRLASKYTFYTGKTAFSYNAFDYSGNQYDLWPHEQEAMGKTVLVVAGFPLQGDSFFVSNGKKAYYQYLDNFISYQKLWFQLEDEKRAYKPAEMAHFHLQMRNASTELFKNFAPDHAPSLWYSLVSPQGFKQEEIIADLRPLLQTPSSSFDFNITLPSTPGKYTVVFGVSDGRMPARKNSDFYPLVIRRRD